MNKRQIALLVLTAIATFFLSFSKAQADNPIQTSPIVHALLFYSPTCGHCHKVITEDLPPLIEKYGDQLQIMGINVATVEGQNLYQVFLDAWKIPDDKRGVPTLVVGDQYLVGSGDIPAQFPGIVENGLQAGGIDWPNIPGLDEIIVQLEGSQPGSTENTEPANTENTAKPTELASNDSSMIFPDEGQNTIADRFKQDLAGNILAIAALLGMIISVVWVLIRVLSPVGASQKDWSWLIPILSIIGLFVAGYLSFVEVTETEAVCGPIGNCNAVQQSPYAILFGFLPVGILGLLGYLAIISAWLLRRFGPDRWHGFLTMSMWGMALFGVLFSIYLTFLEPFVIGATCAWCVSSAIIITIQLWAVTEPVRQLWADSGVETFAEDFSTK
jgi:uncharacterized membrane protein